jgi:glycosyltransferase involved in cell wall biosynthesis
MRGKNMFSCDIGIMAYNEEKNISRLLQALLDQNLKAAKISNIFVIASGCTDRTEEIVRDFSVKNKRIKLLLQEKR